MHPAADADSSVPGGRLEIAGRDRLIWPALNAVLQPIADARHPARATVLDCGGGSGSLAVPLAVLGAQVVVLDISVDALATLGRRAEEAGVAARVDGVQGDIEDIGLRALGDQLPAAPTFDVVLAHGVLDGIDAAAAVLDRLIAAVARGGSLSVVVANPVAAILARAIGGDIAGALTELAPRDHRTAPALDGARIVQHCAAAGLAVQVQQGIGVITDLVPGAMLESTPGADGALIQFEQAAARVEPYRSIASRLHIIASRPG